MLRNGERTVGAELTAVPLHGGPVSIDKKAEVHDVGVGLVELSSERVKKPGKEIVVAVDKQDVFAPCADKTRVSRVAETAVELVHHNGFFGRFSGKPVAERTAFTVGRAVVYQNDLVVISALIQDGAKAGLQVILDVIHGDNDAEFHFSASLSRSRSRVI